MSNKSFDLVIQQVLKSEGVDISSLILKVKNFRVAAVTPEQMSDEYKKYKDKYMQLSKNHQDNAPLSPEEIELNHKWNVCYDRCEDIMEEMTTNIWYFFREVLIVPHEIVTHGELVTDIRDADDDHFQLMIWSAKALWMYENRISGIFLRYNGMQKDILLAGIILYELLGYAKQNQGNSRESFNIMNYVTVLTENIAHASVDAICNLVEVMLTILGERYSFMEDLIVWAMDHINDRKHLHMVNIKSYAKIPNAIAGGVTSTNGFVVTDSYCLNDISTIYKSKQNGITSVYLGFVSNIQHIDKFPELTFSYIMLENSTKCAHTCRAIFGIHCRVEDVLTPHNVYQKITLRGMYRRCAHSIAEKDRHDYDMETDITKTFINEIGYIWLPDNKSGWMNSVLSELERLYAIVSQEE